MFVNKNERDISFCKNVDLDYYWKKKTIISFVLSIFVVFVHMSSFSQYVYESTSAYAIVNFCKMFFKNSFVRMAVPLFFIISGATLFRNYNSIHYKQKLISKVKTLLVPYFCWNILNVFFSIATSYSFVSNYFIGRQKFELSFSNIFLSIFLYKGNIPLWFIFALMFFLIITPIIDLIIRKKSIGVFFVFILVISLGIFDIRIPNLQYFEAESIIYYLVGCFIGKHYFNAFKLKASTKIQVIGSILFMIITVYKMCVAYEVIELIKALDIIIIIVYALSFWVMTDTIINKITLKPYMQNSFFIYVTHVNISAIIIKIFYLTFPKMPIMSILNFIVCSILTIIIICILCKFLNRYMPRTYKILSGNR